MTIPEPAQIIAGTSDIDMVALRKWCVETAVSMGAGLQNFVDVAAELESYAVGSSQVTTGRSELKTSKTSTAIAALMDEGLSRSQIARKLGLTLSATAQTMWRIRKGRGTNNTAHGLRLAKGRALARANSAAAGGSPAS